MKKNEEGFVKFHRKLKRNKFYTDANTMLLFFHIILEASWFDSDDEKRGELKTSVSELAEDLKKDRKTIRKSLNILIDESIISVRKSGKNSIIKVKNYDLYQDSLNDIM